MAAPVDYAGGLGLAAAVVGVVLLGQTAFLRQIGASTGVAVVGALITSRLAGAGFAEEVPFVFALMAPLLAVAFGLAVALPARPLRTTAYVEESVP